MAGFGQQAKRQKARDKEGEYFQGVDKLEYNSSAGASETACYRYYNAGERLHSRSIEEWLKLSLSFTHFKNNGSIIHTRPPLPRAWDDGTNSVENNKRCLKALFELCSKLGIKYWTAFDTDLVPFRDSWDEMRTAWDEMTEYIQELMQRYHVKLMWLAPDLHSHHRYTYGAATSDATTFAMAATQIKKCLEMSQRLNAECFLIWPCREGYDSIYQTDVAKEIKLFAKMLKMTADYKDRLNYRCQLLIMPYYGSLPHVEDWQHYRCRQNNIVSVYMWDVTSCLYLLKQYNLERWYKVVTHQSQHHLYMAHVYNMLGGVSISSEIDHCDHRTFTLMMKCIVDQGGPPPSGVWLPLPAVGAEPRDVTCDVARRVDAAARALRAAISVHNEHLFNRYRQQKYQSYQSGFGSRLITTDISIEECEDHYKKTPNNTTHIEVPSKETIELVFQRYIDFAEHV